MSITTDTGTFHQAESIDPPAGAGYFCEICSKPLTYGGRGRKPRFCDDHKTPAQRNAAGNDGTQKPARTRRGKKHRAATETEWNQFLGIALLSLTYVLGRFVAGGTGLLLDRPPTLSDDEFEQSAEFYSMTAEEVRPIAALVAKRATPSALNKRAGWLVVQSLELEEVGAALWEYGKRIGPAFAHRIQNKAPTTHVAGYIPVRRQPGVTTQQDSAVASPRDIVAAYRSTQPPTSGNGDTST
jgi:hypothetical protein